MARKITAAEVPAALLEMWEKFRPLSMERLQAIEQAVAGLRAGQVAPELVERACGEAHKIAGGAGSFGFGELSKSARRLELLLESPPGAADAGKIVAEADHLRRLMDESFTAPAG